MPLELGSILHGQYRIDAVLSEHAYGGVYRSYDLDNAKLCVVKEILSVPRREFIDMADELLPRIHPNLASVLNYFSVNEEHHFLVMEYVYGESLSDRVTRLSALPEREAIVRVSQVLVALDYLHTRTSDLLHCDVNPSNIFVTPDDLTVLVGYGMGRSLSPGTTATFVAPEYMAGKPEVASDVYAAGATLYFALTGKIPGSTDRGWTDRFSIEPLHNLEPDLSPEIVVVVDKSMRRKIDERYESVREFRKALGRAAVRAGIGLDEPVSGSSREDRWPLSWGASVLTAAIVAMIAILAYYNWDKLLMMPAQSPTTVVVVAAIPEPSSTIMPPSPTAAPAATSIPSKTSEPTKVAQTLPVSTSQPSATLTPTATYLSPTDTSRPTPTLGIGSTVVSAGDGALLVYVPEGEFLVGSTWSDKLAMDDERPQQSVYLPSFWIDQTEVTNGQYRICAAAGMCSQPRSISSATRITYFENAEYDNYPVIWVNWSQAMEYCAWAGRRLPTDIEWEKAARGTDGRIYPWGNDAADELTDAGEIRANFGSLSSDTNVVGSYASGASPYGALDMAGNVSEWVEDFYRSHYYQYVQWLTATLEAEWRFRGGQHGVRNGSWTGSLINIRAAYRGFSAQDDYVSHNLGFRCASTLPR